MGRRLPLSADLTLPGGVKARWRARHAPLTYPALAVPHP